MSPWHSGLVYLSMRTKKKHPPHAMYVPWLNNEFPYIGIFNEGNYANQFTPHLLLATLYIYLLSPKAFLFRNDALSCGRTVFPGALGMWRTPALCVTLSGNILGRWVGLRMLLVGVIVTTIIGFAEQMWRFDKFTFGATGVGFLPIDMSKFCARGGGGGLASFAFQFYVFPYRLSV